MLALLVTLYAMSVVFLLRVGLTDDIRRFREVLAVIGTTLAWPVYHLSWRDRHPGRHRTPRHDVTGHHWAGFSHA